MSANQQTTERGAPCARCNEETVVDGERAGVRAGRLLCADCADTKVKYVAECLDCDWDYECVERAFNWYHAQTRVQQEGNSHESRRALDNDPGHETVWRFVEGRFPRGETDG